MNQFIHISDSDKWADAKSLERMKLHANNCWQWRFFCHSIIGINVHKISDSCHLWGVFFQDLKFITHKKSTKIRNPHAIVKPIEWIRWLRLRFSFFVHSLSLSFFFSILSVVPSTHNLLCQFYSQNNMHSLCQRLILYAFFFRCFYVCVLRFAERQRINYATEKPNAWKTFCRCSVSPFTVELFVRFMLILRDLITLLLIA